MKERPLTWRQSDRSRCPGEDSVQARFVSISYVLPGFPYTAYDRAMNIPIQTYSHIIEGYQMYYGANSPLSEFDEFRLSGTNLSIVCCRHTFSPEFYGALALGKGEAQMDLTPPHIVFDNRLICVGTTSFEICTQTSLRGDNRVLAVSRIKYVRVDGHGRVLTTPPTFINSLGDGFRPEVALQLAKFSRVSEAFAHEVVVPYSDLDSNLHVNHKGYLRYAMEAATAAALESALPSFSGDIAWLSLREVESLY